MIGRVDKRRDLRYAGRLPVIPIYLGHLAGSTVHHGTFGADKDGATETTASYRVPGAKSKHLGAQTGVQLELSPTAICSVIL